MQSVELPALGVAVLLAFSWIAWSAVRARSRDPLAAGGGAEEPLLRPAHVIACRSGSPLLVIVGMEPGSGVSTLAFNLAVSLAAEGEVLREEGVRSPRPICLLTEGPLTDALGLSPAPLEDHLGWYPQRIDADLVDLPIRHVSGCELLCVGREGRAVEHLKLLVEELRRLYDAVLVDGGCGKGQVEDVAVDVGDAMLLVGLHSESLLEAAGPWVERVFALEIEHKTMLVLNRVTAWPQPPREMDIALLYHAQLPDEPAVAAHDAQGVPWCIDARLSAAQRLAAIVLRLFPTLMPGAASNAA